MRTKERQGLTRYPRPSPTQPLTSAKCELCLVFTGPISTAVCCCECSSLLFLLCSTIRSKCQTPWRFVLGTYYCLCLFLFFPLSYVTIGVKKTDTCSVHHLDPLSTWPSLSALLLPGWSHPPHHSSSFVFTLYHCPYSQMNLGQSYFTVDTNSPEILPESWLLHMHLPKN